MSTTIRRRRVLVPLTGAALIAVLLAGCSGPSKVGATPAPTRTPAAPHAPAVAATPTPSPTAPSSSPVPTGAAAPTAPAVSTFRMDDPSTWTISGDEVGPIALGGRTSEETDDLAAALKLSDGECPAAPETQFWTSSKGPNLIVTDNHGVVSGVAIGDYEPESQTSHGPTTKAGAGVGTSLTELQRLYPSLAYAGTYLDERAAYSMWRLDADGGPIMFQLGDDGVHVGMVWVSAHPLPYEFCA